MQLKNKILMISGGTGSFGNAVLDKFLDKGLKEIRILSRDEKKQDDLRKKYSNNKIKFFIGDVRDPSSLELPFEGVDYAFHAAALKQVPSCEFSPLEAVKTNIIGTSNVIDVAYKSGVRKIICLSTDKAVYPINAMGISKAMMEKVFVAKSRQIPSNKLTICGTRYGNVMASRGSVIPLFAKQIMQGEPITLTDPYMTRFLMSLDEAVDLVLYAFENGNTGEIFVQKSPASTIKDIAKAMTEIFDAEGIKIKHIGTRHGEKKHETLLSREEFAIAKDLGDYFVIPPDIRELNYSNYIDKGLKKLDSELEYTSENTKRLDVEETKSLIENLPLIRNAKDGNYLEPE